MGSSRVDWIGLGGAASASASASALRVYDGEGDRQATNQTNGLLPARPLALERRQAETAALRVRAPPAPRRFAAILRSFLSRL